MQHVHTAIITNIDPKTDPITPPTIEPVLLQRYMHTGSPAQDLLQLAVDPDDLPPPPPPLLPPPPPPPPWASIDGNIRISMNNT